MAMGANNGLAALGLGTSQIPRSRQWQIALVFSCFEAVMPIVGMYIGESLAGFVGDKAKWVGVAVLALVGLYSLVKRDGAKDESQQMQQAYGSKIVFLAIALSLDNLTVGFGLGMFHAPLVVAAIVFGLVSFTMTSLGLELGRYVGRRVSISSDKLSGTVLLLAAGAMMFI